MEVYFIYSTSDTSEDVLTVLRKMSPASPFHEKVRL
jgi:hypothetical protein